MNAAAPAGAPAVQLVAAPAAPPNLPPGSPHILLVVDQLSRTLGGGERVLLRLAELLPAYGFRVSILTLSLHPESPALRGPVPCPIYLLALERTLDLHAARSALALRRFLIRQDVRLVQTFFESSDLWVGLVARTVPGLRLIWSRRDMGILRAPKHQRAYRLLRRMPDLVFAVSDEVRRHALEVDGIAPDKVITLYNGVEVPATDRTDRTVRSLRSDRSDRSEAPNAPGPLHLVALGNLRPVKGFDLLLTAVAGLVGEGIDLRLTVAGAPVDPLCAAALGEQSTALGLDRRVTFAGSVDDVAALLAQADLFVLPSRSEGFSNAVLEAMAAGLPVVATAVGGNAEAIRTGVSGLIVPPEDVPALQAALRRLSMDPALRTAMGRAARQEAQNRFSVAAMMETAVSSYCRLHVCPNPPAG